MRTKENMIAGTRDFDNEISLIINDMNLQRNRPRNMCAEEIHQKLLSTNPLKMGEYYEFMQEYQASEGRLTPDLALEVADIIYYTSQPNCSEEDRLFASKVEDMVGVDHKLAQKFCILKYSYRAYDQRDGDDYKKIEREKMVNFLNNINLGILE
jgi:hypothetical protein